MGRQWVKQLKSENSAKKGALITKLAREIQVAAKLGGADANFNARLRMAIDAAKKNSVTSDTIDRAIKKGSGQLEGQNIEEITYEGYGPHGVGVILESQSDNKNRTASEVRLIFKSNGGNLGEMGSVAWMFERVSSIEAHKTGNFDPEEEAIEAGANEVESVEGGHLFYGAPEELDHIRKGLEARGWKITGSELSYKAKNTTTLTDIQKKDVITFLTELDDHDDTHRVHVTLAEDA